MAPWRIGEVNMVEGKPRFPKPMAFFWLPRLNRTVHGRSRNKVGVSGRGAHGGNGRDDRTSVRTSVERDTRTVDVVQPSDIGCL